MKKFNFHLESYLQLKRIKEQEQLSQLAKVNGKINAYREEVEKSSNDATFLLRKESQKMKSEKLKTNELLDSRRYLNFLRVRANVANVKINEMQSELAQKRESYLLAVKETKAVEALKKEAFKQYQVEYNRYDRKESDELNLNRWSRGNKK